MVESIEGPPSKVHKSRAADLESVTGSASDYGRRMTLSNTHEFLFTCVLYVVGLGNIIRFPELMYTNGGGSFLLAYLPCLVLIGVPIFYLELSFGQYASLGPITVWRASPIFKGVGYGVVISSLLIAISYNVTVSCAIYYLFASMQKVLPWSYCQEHLPDEGCIDTSDAAAGTSSTNASTVYNMSMAGTTPSYNSSVSTVASTTALRSTAVVVSQVYPSEQFYYREFLKVSDGLTDFGRPHWRLCLCLILAWIIVFIILTQEVKSAGRISLILYPFPYIILTAFIIQSFVVDSRGAGAGLKYLITPQWEYLARPSLWFDAVSQVFFSLSLMQGGLITLSSYNKFHHNIYRAAILIPVVDTVTSIFAALAVFSVLGVMANTHGIDISQVISGSSGGSFIAFAEAVTMMPLSQLWSTAFFLIIVCLGIGTQYVLVETAATALIDEYPERLGKKRIQLIGWICALLFALGVPLTCPGGFYLQALLDKFTSSYASFLLALVFIIARAWVYDIRQLSKDTKAMLGRELSIVWKVIWTGVTPAAILIMFLLSIATYQPLRLQTYFIDYDFPTRADLIGWLLLSAIQIIPFFTSAILLYLTTPKAPIRKKLEKLSKPSLLWGPALGADQLEQEAGGTAPSSKRVYDRSSSVKVGKDIGGLDSIFSATVGNNVLVKMATSMKAHPSEKDLQRSTSARMRYSPSADLLAKRMDTNGGPITFQEDGETYMLVPKRKNRPPGVDKGTQTESIYKMSVQRDRQTVFHIGDVSEEEDDECCNVQIAVTSSDEGIDNPVIVIESK